MDSPTLSESAHALLRFRLKGHRIAVTPQNLGHYRELARLGLAEAVAGPGGAEADFLITEKARSRPEEWMGSHWRAKKTVVARPNLSPAARSLLRRHASGQSVEVDGKNRPAYRELAAAGVMIPMHGFSQGDEAFYKFTEEGWERRFELIGPSPGGFAVRLRRWAAGFRARVATPLHASPTRTRPVRGR